MTGGRNDTKIVKVTIGERIKTAREDKQLSRKRLTEQLNKLSDRPTINGKQEEMSEDRLKTWEYGTNTINIEWIPLFCEVLDCDVGYLFGEYEEKKREFSDVCKVTGLSEKAIVCLQNVNPIAAWRNPLHRGSTSNDSVFVKMPYIEKTHDLLSVLITSEYFLDMIGEIGLYLIDAGELPEGFINKSSIELTRDEAEKFNDWMDYQNKVPYNREEVAGMHLQQACDYLKAIYKKVLEDRLETRDKNG